MKGSGWVIVGIVAILVLIVILIIFARSAFAYKLKEQKIVFDEVEILRVKNTLLLAERSLAATWQVSSVQAIFFAGQKGFGNEYWYKMDMDRKQLAGIPTNDDIKRYIENLLVTVYRPNVWSTLVIDGLGLKIEMMPPLVTMEDSRIIAAFSQFLTAFAGFEQTPQTSISRNSGYTADIAIQLKKLTDAGKAFIEMISKLALPYSSSTNANSYLEQARNLLTSGFNRISFPSGIEKTLTILNNELVVSADLSKLLFHYIVQADFTQKEAKYNYIDEERHKLEKKPFSLTVKAEDYLVALNCAENNGILFTYASSNDMTCDGGKLYTCNTPIDGIGNNKLTCMNNVGQRAGSFACGFGGFAGVEAVDKEECYCRGFEFKWLPPVVLTCFREEKKLTINAQGDVIESTELVPYQFPCPAECEPRACTCPPQ